MPMKPIQVKANFQLDTSAARAQLQGLQKELTSVTKGATMNLGMTEEITKAVKQAELLKQVLREATDIGTGNFDLSKFTQAMNQNMTSIQQFKNSLASLGPEGEKAFNSLANTIASAQVPLKRTSQGVSELMTAFGNTMRWQATSMAMHKVVGTIQQAFNYAQNLDKSLTNIQIVTGHNTDYMRNFAREANKAAQALSASTLEYTNASLIYYQQGLGDKEVAKRAETTLKLAKVTGESASKVSQQMTAVWNNFSNGVDNLERYADVMTALGATTASSSSEIAKGLEKFASVTKTIGLSYDYAASALATVTAQTRQSADSVGTAFKTLFSRLESLNLGETLDDSVTLNKYSEALLKVGVNVMDVNGHLKNMDNILDELGGRWNSLNKAQQVALAQTVGGVRNYTSLITLMDNWQDFQTNVTTSQLAEGTLQKQADIYAKSWEAAQQRVKTASQGIYDTLISSDFFKGFNNAFAGALNQINDLGKHLGTGGSLAGLMALTNYFAGDKIASKIDNATVNFLGNTRYGQVASAKAKAETFADMRSAIAANGDQLDARRLNVLDATTQAWQKYANTVNNNGRHGNAYISQPAIQSYYNQLSTLTERGLAAMNLSVDAKTAISTRQSIDSKAYQDLARLGSKTITGQRRPTINTAGMIDLLDTNKVTQGQINGIGQRKALLSFQEQLNAASSPAARRSIIANMQRFVDSGLNQSVKNTGEAILRELNSNPQGSITPEAAKLFGALSQQTERMQAGVATRAFNVGVRNRADLFKGADGRTVQTTAAGMIDARVNEVVTDLLAGSAVEGVEEGMERLKADTGIKEYRGIRGAFQYWRDTKGQAIKDRTINGLKAKQYEERDKDGNLIGTKYYTQTTGEFIMQTAQVFNTLSMATSSFQSSMDSLKQGTLTASQALGTFGSGLLATSTLSTTLFNNKKLTNAFGSMAGGFLPNLYQNLGNTALGSKLGLGAEGLLTAEGALTSFGAAIPIALAAAAIGIGISQYQEYKRNTSDARLSRANESKITLSALSKENKNKADNYLSVVSAQQQSYNKLFGLQQGTTGYTSQLLSSNAQAQELIDTYNLQVGKDYSIDENGAYYFSAEQIKNTDEQIQQQANESILLSQLANDRIYQLQDYANDLSAKPYGVIERMKGRKTTLYGLESLTESEINNVLSTKEKMQYLEMSPEEYAQKITGKDSGIAYNKEIAAMRQDQIELQGYITAEQRAQSSYEASLNAYISTQQNVSDAQQVAINLLGQNSTKQREYQDKLYDLSKDDLDNIKKNGKYLEVGQLQREYLKHSDIYNLPLDRSLTNDQLGAMMEQLQAQHFMKQQINDIIEEYGLQDIDISDYARLNSLSYTAFDKMISEHAAPEFQSLNIMALEKQANAQENLAQALLHNTNIQDTNFREQSRLIQQTLDLSLTEQENLTNYINNFGTNFGDNTGKAIYDALTTNGTQWNERFYEALQNISTSNSISSLADLTYQSTLSGNADLQASMESLRKAMLADIDDRGGLAKTLFSSSEFTKVFESLQDQYKTTGQITAQNIADLAKKNEIIGDYMRVSGSNEQTIADLMEMVSSGNIGIEGITPALEHFVQNMNGSEGAQQEALDTLEQYNFSDSITDMDKGYQNIGKVFYNGRVNDVLYDNPVREALNLLLTPDDMAKYERIMAIQAYGGTTKDIMAMFKEEMPEAYAALTTLEGTGKKKGKGGGGFDTAIEYWSKKGLFEGSGIQVNQKTGRIDFGEDFETNYNKRYGENSQVTASNFREYVIDIFKNAGVEQQLAETWAQQVTGKLSASSFGSLFNSGGLIESVQSLWGDLTGEQTLGHNLTGEQINAIFNQYREIFARMKIEDGQLKELTLEELQDMEKNPGIQDIGKWQEYIAEQARKNGVAIIDIKGKELLNGKSASIVGEAIAKHSMETITESGISGLIQAAVMSGVQQYEDYTINERDDRTHIGKSLDYDQLQKFYTDTLGLTTEDLNRHIDELNKEGTGVTHKWTDAYGVEHNLSSRGMTGTEFTQKIQHDSELTQQIIDMQRTQWINEIMSNPDNAGLSYLDIAKLVNEREQEEIFKVQQAAREGVQSSKEATTPEGTPKGETEPTEGEEETPPEGSITSTTGIVTTPEGAYNAVESEAQKVVGEYKNYTYRGNAEAEKVYKYNLLHPKLTPAQAYDAVHSGKVDVDAEWNKKYPPKTSKEQQEEEKTFREEGDKAAAAARETYQRRQAEKAAVEAAKQFDIEEEADQGTASDLQKIKDRKDAEKAEKAAVEAAKQFDIEEEADQGTASDLQKIKDRKDAERAAELAAIEAREEAEAQAQEDTRLAIRENQEAADAQWLQEHGYGAEYQWGTKSATELRKEKELIEAAQQFDIEEEADQGTASDLQKIKDRKDAEKVAQQAEWEEASQAAMDREDNEIITSNEEAEKWIEEQGLGFEYTTGYNGNLYRSPADFKRQYEQRTVNATVEQPVQNEENQIDQNEVNTQAQAITQAMQQSAFSTFSTNLANNQLYDVSGISGYNVANITAEEQDTLKRLQADADAYANMSDKERREAGLSKAELSQRRADSQEAADLYRYQNMMSPEQRMAEINKALDIYDGGKGESQLTPFQKFLMNSIGEIVDYQGIMADATEEDTEAGKKAKQAQVNEEGELVDEEGNPIEMPEGQQPSGNGGGGRDSGGDTGTGGGPGGSGKGKGKPTFATSDGNGGFNYFDDDGNQYAPGSGGEWIEVRDENTGGSSDYNTSYTYTPGGHGHASGQNNARLLAYASGKEGHIAITGELGPELRVKSDGSMDILGKTGREYAWVEPSDRIYTASQSAGILKSNKIPGLEGLAKGINNFIPGYATAHAIVSGGASSDQGSSGSGGGGGGGGGSRSRGGGGDAGEKDPRYDPKTLKIRDVLERYYTILQQIDNITKAVERFSKVADRAWGRERIRAIEHQNELQQKQYEAQKKYIAEIEGYLETDQSAMTTMIREFVEGWNKAVDENTDPNNTMEKISWAGAQFDQDGVLTNYRDFVEKLVEQYNQNAASANQETQYKFQEQLKDIQMYTDTLNLYEEQINALEDIKNAILDTAIKVVSYEVEYKLELSGDTDRILNFQADKYKDDVYQAAKYLELLDQRADLTRKNLETVTEGIMKTLGNYAGENMRVGALHTLDELGVYGTNKFKIPEELLEELDEDDEEDAEKLKELQAERSRNITKQIGAWLEEAYATNKDEVETIEKMLSFSSEEGAGDFTYDEDWRDTYDSWEDYYNEVINKTDNDTERFIDNYEEIISRLNGLVDFQKIRTQVSDWLEELRTKDAEAAIEIDKIIRYTEDGQIANYSDVLEKLNEANVKLNDEFINLLYTDQEAFFKAMSDFQNNPGWVDFTTEHKDQLTNWMDAIYQYLESLQDTYEQTIEQLGDSIKATAKQMDAAVDEFDYYGDVYKTFGNIVDLTNRHMTDISQDFFNTLNNKSMDNSINKIKATVTNYHLLQNELAEVTKQYNEMQARANAATGEEQIYLQQSADKLKEQLDIANNQYEDAHKAFLSSWEDALSKMAENYKAAVEEAAKNFEQGFSPLFNTLALLQAQFDREKALGDLYVDNYQKIHDLNKLNRDIQLSIDDTDNLKGKERLRDLQAEINQLQEDGTELSEYDLDILDKKYKLELARQALEDAKDAKSMVRLARDNNGNWSYVYTANQDDVDKAEQDYEDAIREMEQANEDYIDNIQDQILQVQQEAQQAILALQPEDFATYEDYLAAVNNIQNSMYQTLDFLRSQLNNAFGNNEWLDPYIVDRYGINDHDLTTDFGDTTLAGLLDNPDIDKAIKKAKENFEDNLKQPILDAFIEYSERQDEVYQAAEHDIATIGKDFQDEMENIADSSEYQVEVVTNLFERVQNSFNDMAAVVDEKTKKHLDEATMLVDVYEKLVEAITKVKELSGENLPIEGGQFIGKIDSWAEIQRLNKELAEHGDYRTLEDLTELNPEDLQDRKDAMQKASEKIGEWMEALLVDSVDEETRTAIQDMVEKDENGLITNYKQVISKLAQLEKTDENKDILKEIKKWRATEQKAMYTSPQQVYKENEGLYTNFIAGDQFTKDYLSWITDQLMYNQMKTVSDSGVTDTEKAEIETYLGAHGGVWVKKGDTEEFFDSLEEWKAWYEDNKKKSGGGGGETGNAYSWGTQAFSKGDYDGGYSSNYNWAVDTGGYTGRWQSADTGMYTGEWPSGSIRRNGRLAWLHQKELVLNAHDTENFLDAMEIVRQLDNLTNWMANGLGDLIMPKVTTESGELEQNVHIEAEFPNVTDHNEIEQAFNNLVNMASQYANRK